MMKKKNTLSVEYTKKLYFFDRGRTAFFYAMRLLDLDKSGIILLPSYIGMNDKEGSGVFDPINKLQADYDFYKLNKDLSINMVHFEKKLKQKNVKAVLIIHYFGFCQNKVDKVVKLCKKYKKYVIEDCAHTLNSYYNGIKLGDFGDLSFFSINKILPTKKGGILKINNCELVCECIKENIDLQTLLLYYKFDLEKASQVRRKNYLYLDKKIRKIKGIKQFNHKLLKKITPLNYPLIIINKDRTKLYFELKNKQIEVVSLYHTLIPAIKEDQYPFSYDISRKILNIPIHEEISFKDIDYFIQIMMGEFE